MTMQEYLDMVARMRQTGMTPGVPRNYMSPLSSRYPAFQNLGSAWQAAQPKPNLGDISAASNPASTRRRGPGRPRLTPEEVQRTASRLGQGTVGKTVKSIIPMLPTFAKWATPLGIGTEMLRSEPVSANQSDVSLAVSQAWQDAQNRNPPLAADLGVNEPDYSMGGGGTPGPSMGGHPGMGMASGYDVSGHDQILNNYDWVDPGGPQVILPGEEDITPRVTTTNIAFEDQNEGPNVIPQDANPAVTGQYGLTQNYGGFSPVMSMLVDQVSDPITQDMLKHYNQKSPFGLPLPKYTQTSTPSGFMPPGTGFSTGLGIPYSTLQWENPNTPEMRALEQQQNMMDAFNNSGMTIEEFSATQPSYTPGTGPSTVVGKQYHPGSLDITPDLAGVITHPRDMMIRTPTSPADILAAAQVDTFRPVEQLRTDRPRTTTSIFDYLPSFISTASAANTFEDSTYPEYQDYLADEKWHGMGIGNVKTGPGSKDFENWMVSRRTEETPVLPDFNTTMFNDIFTDETALPISWYDDSYQADDFIGKMYRDEEATDNVEKFIDIMVQPNVPAQPTPVVQTRRTTPAPVVTPTVTESDEIAMMVRDVVARNAIRDQVRQDLMAGRDRGEPSHAEVQAAINAMMGNEFGGMRGIGFMGADIGREDGGGFTGGDFSGGAGWE